MALRTGLRERASAGWPSRELRSLPLLSYFAMLMPTGSVESGAEHALGRASGLTFACGASRRCRLLGERVARSAVARRGGCGDTRIGGTLASGRRVAGDTSKRTSRVEAESFTAGGLRGVLTNMVFWSVRWYGPFLRALVINVWIPCTSRAVCGLGFYE